MKKLILLLILITIPSAVFALEQSFAQQGIKATVKLSPEKLETGSKIQLSLNLSKDGASLTDRNVTLEVYEKNADKPFIQRPVDVLDTEYVDSWKFEKPGDYKVVIKIADHQKPDEVFTYEVNASVMDAGAEHGGHGFFAHHFGGGSWGWWGTGLMIVIMVPMMVLIL